MLTQRPLWSAVDPKLRSQALAAVASFTVGSFVLRLSPKLSAVVAFAVGEVAGYRVMNVGSELRAEEDRSELPDPLDDADLTVEPLDGVDEATLE